MPTIASSVVQRGARTWARPSVFAALLGAVLGTAHGCGASVFECASSDECQGTGEVGTCQPEGWCSFADPACASGQRFGDRAPSGIAGECVDADGESTGVGGTDATSATSASSTTSSSTSTSATSTSATTTAGPTTDPMTSSSADTTASASDTEITTSVDTGDEPVCGNGIVERGEACEPSDGDACRDDCQFHACGDGVLGPGEECDGPDVDGTTCQEFGFEGGMLACVDCQISVAGCGGCGNLDCEMSCTSEEDCNMGEACVIAGGEMLGSCWPICKNDKDCALAMMGAQCFFLEPGPVCLYPCDMVDECPDNLECTALENMGLACL